MYQLIDRDGKTVTTDIEKLKAWARTGVLTPDVMITDRNTGQDLRADQLLPLRAIFQGDVAAPPAKMPVPIFAIIGIVAVVLVLLLLVGGLRSVPVPEDQSHIAPAVSVSRPAGP